MTLKRVLLVILLCLLAIVGLPGGMPKPALACSGVAHKLFAESYKDSDILVKATVLTPDDAGQNALVQVERYYKGGAGAAQLLFFRHPLSVTLGLGRGNLGGGDCNYWAQPVQRGDTVYFLGTRDYAGAYKSDEFFANEVFIYHHPSDVATLETIENGEFVVKTLKETEFQDYLTQTMGGKWVAPDPTLPLPRSAPLLLTTKDGKRWVLPIDTDKLFDVEADLARHPEDEYPSLHELYASFRHGRERCIGVNCLAYPPQNSPHAMGTYRLRDCAEGPPYQAMLFSPADTYVLWSNNQLFLGCRIRLIATLQEDSTHNVAELAAYAQWSPDGHTLAYNDARGLWLWEDKHQPDNNPRLLIPATQGSAYARYFSPKGTHLAITQGEQRYTLNLETGKTMFDGIFSPTEEYFLAVGATDAATGTFPAVICKHYIYDYGLSPCDTENFEAWLKEHTSPDMIRSDEPLGSIKQAEWVGDFSLRLLVYPRVKDVPAEKYWDAKQGYVLSDYIVGDSTGRNVIYPTYEAEEKEGRYQALHNVISGFAFVYDHDNKSLALRQNDTTIFIDNKSYDFSKQLSSPIVQIDWLPSLLYRDRAR